MVNGASSSVALVCLSAGLESCSWWAYVLGSCKALAMLRAPIMSIGRLAENGAPWRRLPEQRPPSAYVGVVHGLAQDLALIRRPYTQSATRHGLSAQDAYVGRQGRRPHAMVVIVVLGAADDLAIKPTRRKHGQIRGAKADAVAALDIAYIRTCRMAVGAPRMLVCTRVRMFTRCVVFEILRGAH